MIPLVFTAIGDQDFLRTKNLTLILCLSFDKENEVIIGESFF